jgi:serine/threonine protein kinase
MGADAAAEEQFGPYLVYERLGVGGMATVHRALERGIEGFERIVALKRLLPHLAADASFIKSFVREAKLASLLNHVNIVQIFKLGRVGTQYFISMEYIDGRDIRRILRHARKASGPPPIHVTVGMLLQLCDALDYAHRKVDDAGHPLRLVHRDVSPSNVLVTSAGQIKVIDFGIAKAQGHQRTQTGRVKGKLAYMAPEALAGKDLDARSDLFAVGVIAHELLTERPLFATKNEYQTLMKVQRGDILPPSTFNQGCPPELDAIVLRALARDPDERFRHASDLRDALNAIRKQHNLQTTSRDIATWLEWAFSLEVPSGGLAIRHTLDHPHGALGVRPSPRHRPSRPKRNEEDEAVDLAWGGGEEHNGDDPIVLDDVPDVTDKRVTSEPSLGADGRLGRADLADDIPAAAPGHGHGIKPSPAIPSRTVTTSLRPPRTKQPTSTRPARPSQIVPLQAPRDRSEPVRIVARGAQDDIATRNLEVGAGVRSTMPPPRGRTITIPPLRSTSAAPRTVPSLSPPPPTTPPPLSMAPSQGAPEPPTPPRGHRATSPTSSTATARPDTSATKHPPPVSLDEFGIPSDTIPSMPMAQASEAFAPFHAPTHPLPEATPPPVNKPGSAPLRLVTPVTELSAGPEPHAEREVTPADTRDRAKRALDAQRPSSGEVPEMETAPHRRTMLRRVLIVLLVLVLAGAVATAAALYLAQVRATATESEKSPPPPSNKAAGTLKFVVAPADSVVTIEGMPRRHPREVARVRTSRR